MNKLRTYLFMLLAVVCLSAFSQGTVEDYKRAWSIRGKYSNKMLHGDVRAQAIGKTHRFWYSESSGGGLAYKVVDCDKETVSPLFDKEQLRSQLAEKTGRQVYANRMNLNNVRVMPAGENMRGVPAGEDERAKHDRMTFEFEGKRWS